MFTARIDARGASLSSVNLHRQTSGPFKTATIAPAASHSSASILFPATVCAYPKILLGLIKKEKLGSRSLYSLAIAGILVTLSSSACLSWTARAVS